MSNAMTATNATAKVMPGDSRQKPKSETSVVMEIASPANQVLVDSLRAESGRDIAFSMR
jgi:hypothetical protein